MVTIPILRTANDARAFIKDARTKGYEIWLDTSAGRPILCAGKDRSAPPTWTAWCPEQIARTLQLD